MTKKNQAFSWRNARDEELGFSHHGNPAPVGSSGTKEENREHSHIDASSSPQQSNRVHGGNHDVVQLGYSRSEVSNTRALANDELYVSSNEHPGMNLTTDLFDGSNFHNWTRAIKRALISRNKLSLVDGSLRKPHIGSVDYMQWLRVDYLVYNWINNSMKKEISRGFQNLETSKDLWEELHRRFGKKNGPRIYKLRRDIAIYAQSNQSVMIYFNNLSSLWDELSLLKTSRPCHCEALEDTNRDLEEEHMMGFLMGLNDCFEAIRQQILILDPLPSVSQAYAMVLQVEEQMSVSNHFADTLDQSAMYVNPKSGFKGDFFKKRLTREEKAKLKCEHCGGMGHIKAECFELIGVPDWYMKFKAAKGQGRAHCVLDHDLDSKMEQDSSHRGLQLATDTEQDVSKLVQSEIAKHMAAYFKQGVGADNGMNVANLAEVDFGNNSGEYTGHYAFGVSPGIKGNEWIIDSGASSHMCCQLGLLSDLKRLREPIQIFLPDGTTVWVFLIGTARLNKDISLQNVLFAPGFTHNLLSVGQLTKDIGGTVQFLASHCLIQAREKDHILGICKMKGSLYIFPPTMPMSATAHNVQTSSLEELHCRLGHPSASTMKHFSWSKKRFRSEEYDDLQNCIICFEAKQQRDPFPTSHNRSSCLFALIHVDVWGPCKDASISDTPYFLTIVEDCSRATWTFLFKAKSQVWIILQSFILMVKNRFKTDIQTVRTDNGGEFVNSQMTALLSDYGITHQRTCPYTPQQNGVVERKHRHLLQVARAVMFQSRLPSSFWCYSVLALQENMLYKAFNRVWIKYLLQHLIYPNIRLQCRLN